MSWYLVCQNDGPISVAGLNIGPWLYFSETGHAAHLAKSWRYDRGSKFWTTEFNEVHEFPKEADALDAKRTIGNFYPYTRNKMRVLSKDFVQKILIERAL